MNELTKTMLSYALVLGLGFAIAYTALPSRVVEKEHTVYQDRIVVKEVEKKNTDKKNNRTYIRIVTTHPDGTSTTETRIVDMGETVTVSTSQKDSTEETKVVTDKEKETIRSTNDTLISLGVNNNIAYGLHIQKRLLGPIFVGGFGYTDKNLGLNVGIAF